MSAPRVVMVSLDWIRPQDPRTGLGTASLVAALRESGAEVSVVESPVNAPDFDVDDLIAQVVDQVGPGDVVGIGAFVWNEAVVRRLLGALSEVRVVLGGAQVSFAPQGTLESTYPGAWAFVRGHGELGMVELAWGREPSRRSGVHFAGTTDRGARAELELGALPSPHLDGTLAIGPFVRWETQRGCPYACTFCQHREVGRKLRDRWLGQERLEAELAAFASAGVRRIAVLDPIFHANERRAVELLRAAKRVGLAATLSLQCRAELLGDAFLDALDGLSVELELGLQTVHPDEARAVGRPQDVHRIEAALARIAARGIPYEVSLIYGLPHQTLDRFRASVAWCLDRGVPRVKAFPLMLLRGTPLYEDKESFGYVESEDPIPVAVQSQWFTRDDHAQMAELARWLDDDPPVIAPGDLAARAKLHPTHCTHEDTMSHRDCDYCTDRNGKPKRCYGTRQDALGAASHILRVRKVRLRVYRCEVDLGYHLTSDLDGGWDDGLW